MVPTESGKAPLSDAPPCSRVGARQTDMRAGDRRVAAGRPCAEQSSPCRESVRRHARRQAKRDGREARCERGQAPGELPSASWPRATSGEPPARQAEAEEAEERNTRVSRASEQRLLVW